MLNRAPRTPRRFSRSSVASVTSSLMIAVARKLPRPCGSEILERVEQQPIVRIIGHRIDDDAARKSHRLEHESRIGKGRARRRLIIGVRLRRIFPGIVEDMKLAVAALRRRWRTGMRVLRSQLGNCSALIVPPSASSFVATVSAQRRSGRPVGPAKSIAWRTAARRAGRALQSVRRLPVQIGRRGGTELSGGCDMSASMATPANISAALRPIRKTCRREAATTRHPSIGGEDCRRS